MNAKRNFTPLERMPRRSKQCITRGVKPHPSFLTGFSLAIMMMLVVLPGSALAELSVDDYVFETYATYYHPSPGASPWKAGFDGYGNLYVSHKIDGSIYRIDPDGNAERWVDGLYEPRNIVWGGGTEYGEYLFVSSKGGDIYRIDLEENVSIFATINDDLGPLALDRVGSYGGFMYTGTGRFDHIEKVLPSGTTQRFSDFPFGIGGGPGGIAFDPGMDYGGFMYVGTVSVTSPELSGLFILDVDGNHIRFGSDRIINGGHIEFDTAGLMFGGELFVKGKISVEEGTYFGIYKVDPDGEPMVFPVRRQTRGIYAFAFGPDGAMYVVGYASDESTVIITRISLAHDEVMAVRKIEEAIAKKLAALEKIDAALEKEQDAIDILNELLAGDELGDLTRADILKAKADIHIAILREQRCKAGLAKGIRRLEDALDALGYEVESNVLPDDGQQVRATVGPVGSTNGAGRPQGRWRHRPE